MLAVKFDITTWIWAQEGSVQVGKVPDGPLEMVIVAGADAYRGRSHGLVLDVVRTEDGVDHRAMDFFGRGGGYLTAEP